MTCKIPTKSEIQKFFADEAKERISQFGENNLSEKNG